MREVLTSKIVSDDLPIPGRPGGWMRFRALGGSALRASRDEKIRRTLAYARSAGGEVTVAMQKMRREDADATLAADPLAEHEIDVLLSAGIVAWSLDDKINPRNIADLSEDVQDWAAREILKLSQPTEDDTKNS